MLTEAVVLLDDILHGWLHPISTAPDTYVLRAEDLLEVASLCGSLEASCSGTASVSFVLAETESRLYNIPGGGAAHLRAALGGMSGLARAIDKMRFPELAEADAAMRISFPKVSREALPNILRLLAAQERDQESRGIEQLNPYGFDVTFDYHDKSGNRIPLHVITANDNRTPLHLKIDRL